MTKSTTAIIAPNQKSDGGIDNESNSKRKAINFHCEPTQTAIGNSSAAVSNTTEKPTTTTTTKTSTSTSTSTGIGKARTALFNGRTRGPKFGLVQWQRLVNSSNDLAQMGGAPFRKDISWDEIAKHNQPHDGWLVLNGTVYNVGPYLHYHPGGIDIFTKPKLLLGADGTKAFSKYHPWVSIEGLIGTLAIGTAAANVPPSVEEEGESDCDDDDDDSDLE